jgi:hypothetical protein
MAKVTDEGNSGATVVINHRVRPDARPGYELWLGGISAACRLLSLSNHGERSGDYHDGRHIVFK